MRESARQEEMLGDLQHYIDRHAVSSKDFGPLPLKSEYHDASVLRGQRWISDHNEIWWILRGPAEFDASERLIQARIVSIERARNANG